DSVANARQAAAATRLPVAPWWQRCPRIHRRRRSASYSSSFRTVFPLADPILICPNNRRLSCKRERTGDSFGWGAFGVMRRREIDLYMVYGDHPPDGSTGHDDGYDDDPDHSNSDAFGVDHEDHSQHNHRLGQRPRAGALHDPPERVREPLDGHDPSAPAGRTN